MAACLRGLKTKERHVAVEEVKGSRLGHGGGSEC